MVKVPTVISGYDTLKTKGGAFQAVSATLVERFQSALVAQCHCGSFFYGMGHLVDGLVAQQILEGTYVYPQDLDSATRLLFEEAAATYVALLPRDVATLFTQRATSSGSLYSGLHFGHYIAASFCPDLSLLHMA